MKLIVTGASGLCATEVIRQALVHPAITKIVAVGRNIVTAPEGLDGAKLKSVIVRDMQYTDEVKKEFAGADACIWTAAITWSGSLKVPFEESRRVCQTNTMIGLQAMYESGPAKPFRVLYLSGVGTPRSRDKNPELGNKEYAWMRGETEVKVLGFGEEHKGEVEVSIAKLGLVMGAWQTERWERAKEFERTIGLPNAGVDVIAAALLDQVVKGFEKDTLW